MLTTLLLSFWLGGAAQGRQTPPERPELPVLEVAAHLLYWADGRPGTGIAGNSGAGAFESFTWTDAGCGLGSADREPANLPAVGWHFSAHVLQRVGDAVTVRIEWQRVWDRGMRAADAKTGVLDTTMRVGDRLDLDRAEIASSKCGATGVRLEAAILQKPLALDARGVPVRSGGDRGGRGGGGGRGGAGGPGAGATGVGAAASGRGNASMPTQDRQGQQQVFGVELWLVHTLQDGTITTGTMSTTSNITARDKSDLLRNFVQNFGTPDVGSYQRVSVPASGTGFVFPAVPIATSRGTVSVIMTGTLSARLVNGVPATLMVTVNRQVTGAEPPATGNGSSSTKEIPWPRPDEVISFEFPPTTGLLAGHQFALTLRLAPGGSELPR
jgi:hypothetical protein